MKCSKAPVALLALLCATPGNGTVQTPSAPTASNREFLARNYPAAALQRGESGKVGFQLTIEPDDMLSSCAITQSSGFPNLDRGTCELLVYSAKMEAARNEDGRKVRTFKNGFITWKLPPGLQPAPDSARNLSAKVDPLVCRKNPLIGSVVKTITHCMTQVEWIRQERSAQRELNKLQTEIGCTDHGC